MSTQPQQNAERSKRGAPASLLHDLTDKLTRSLALNALKDEEIARLRQELADTYSALPAPRPRLHIAPPAA